MTIRRAIALAALLSVAGVGDAMAQQCALDGVRVSCIDGRIGILNGDAIQWPDGTRSTRTPHATVIIGDKNSVHIGPNVFAGSPSGVGVMPLDDPNAPNKLLCAIVNGIPYCH